MIKSLVALLVMLNPFALFIYLNPVMEDLRHKDFLRVLWKASLISLGAFLVFLYAGDFIIEEIFQISFESFKIFGGVVIFSFAYMFIVKGQKALIAMKGSLDDVASEIALPFMVGAGTLSIVIFMAHKLSLYQATIGLPLVLIANALIIIFLKYIKDGLEKRRMKVAFDKNMEILLRINGFFIGAIGVDMIIEGVRGLF
ncbi:MAG TPA: MarC family protein [Candidatus Nanoarchaeia archaeon]|nr:MarC family protein [Candidatus Nanoarchaeia archaeon]